MLNASRTSTRTPFDQPGDTLPRSPSSSHYPCIAPPTPRVTLAPNLRRQPQPPTAAHSSSSRVSHPRWTAPSPPPVLLLEDVTQAIIDVRL